MTPNNSPLPIPDQTVVGTGTYVIPVDRYADINMTSSHSATGSVSTTGGNGNMSQTGTGTANNALIKGVAGDSITVSSSSPAISSLTTTTEKISNTSGFHNVLLNSVVQCTSYGSVHLANSSSGNLAHRHQASQVGASGWSVSLYRIPKSNLPVGTAEGE